MQRRLSVMLFGVLVALAMMVTLPGCVGTYDDGGWGPDEEVVGPEWDGQIVVNERGRHDYHHDDHHVQAFHADRGRPVAVGRARGRASMGGRGGHAPAGGHASAGGHAPAGGHGGHR